MATIVLEIPEEVNAVTPALLDVVETVRKQAERGRMGASADFAKFERQLADKMNAVERVALGVALGALDVDLPKVLIDGVHHVRVLRTETTFMGLAGPVSVTRSLYRPAGERNAALVDPVAVRAGAVEKVWLPAAAREMAYLIQQGTSREAQTTGQRLGRLPYSHTSFEHIAHAVGQRFVDQHQQIEQRLIEGFEVPERARSISVSLDRVSVPMEEPRDRPGGRLQGTSKRPVSRVYRMAYCGTVTLHDGEGQALHTIRYGTMPAGDAVALCTGMADDVVEMLGRQSDLKVELLCDGAKEMWNLLDAEFTTAPFDTGKIHVSRLIDFWHAVEKLAPAAKVLFGDEACKAHLARWKLRLKDRSSASAEILAELLESGLEHTRVGDDEPVHEAITYFTNNQHRMDYAAARRAGLPIGSGAVEATCKSLIAMRMKRSGARWKTRTGEHIVHLRALALSDRWDSAMDLTLSSARVKIRPAA